MSNLTIRMDPAEKERLAAWAAVRGTSVTDYIQQLIAADMASGSPRDRASAWFRENEAALAAEADHLGKNGVPGSGLALHHPWPDG